MPVSLGFRRLDYARPVNWEAPLNRGLTAWWLTLPQRASGATWFDLTRGLSAPFTSLLPSGAAAGWGATRRPGGQGEVRFPGTGYARTTSLIVSLMSWSVGSFTAWVRPTASAPSVTSSWEGCCILRDSNDWLGMYQSVMGGLDRLWCYGFAGSEVRVGTPYTLGQWVHLGWVKAALSLSVYSNGLLVDTLPADVIGGPSTSVLALGQSSGLGTFWQGGLDDVRTYNRALAADEVQALYLRSRLRYPHELRWRSPLHVVPLAFDVPADVVGAVPSGITVLWSGTAASIPSGWTRTTALDGIYPRGAAAAAEPGSTGGALTHTHTSTAHSHTTAHTHTVPASTAPTGSTARDTGTTNPPAVHTHAATVTVNPTTATATDTPSTDSSTQQPPYAEVLFLASAGTSLGFPASMLALWNEAGGLPSGWELADGTAGKPDLRGRYLKGATTAGDGGGSGGALTHSHTLASHTHSTPYAHTHPDVTSPQRTEALNTGDIGGATAGTATATHTHTLTIGSSSPAITGSTDAVGSTNHEPPYWMQAYIENMSGALSWPDKLIALWTGSLAAIPANWKLCDGTSGTPDLRGFFIKGATVLGDIGTTGGSLTHTHTATGHTHAIAAHTHTVTAAAGAGENRTAGSTNAPTTAHTHTWAATGSTSLTSGSTTPTVTALSTTAPPYSTVVFVQWQAPLGGATVTQVTSTEIAQAMGPLKTVVLGQSTETTLAQALTALKTVTLGQATATELAQAMGRGKTVVLGQALSTETPQAMTTLKTVTLGQSPETALAQAMGRGKTVVLGQALETTLATAFRGPVVFGQSIETDLAQAMSLNPQARLVTQSSETTVAQAMGRLKTILLGQVLETTLATAFRGPVIFGQALETTLAQAMTWNPRTRLVTLVTETTTAQSMGSLKTILLGQPFETALAQSFGGPIVFGQALETDLAQPMTWNPKARLVNAVTETTTAQALAWVVQRLVVQVGATELAQAMTRQNIRLATQATETTLAQAMVLALIRLVTQRSETDLAQAMAVSPQTRLVTQTSETALAQAMGRALIRLVTQASETTLAQSIAPVVPSRVVQVEEVALAQSVSPLKTVLLGQGSETTLAQAFTRLKTVLLGQSSATEVSQVMRWAPMARLVGQTTETTLAQAVTLPLVRLVTLVSETSTAFSMVWSPRTRLVAQTEEVDTATYFLSAGEFLVEPALETTFAQPVAWSPVRLVTQAVETTAAQEVRWAPQARLVGQAIAQELANALTARVHILFWAITGAWGLDVVVTGVWETAPTLTGVWRVEEIVEGAWTATSGMSAG